MKELLNKLPASWDELTLSQYHKILKCQITEDGNPLQGIENSIECISKLTDEPVEDLELMSMRDLQTLGAKLSWMVTPPQVNKESAFKWKQLDSVTYNDYVTFIQIKEPMENLHLVIKAFSTTQLTEEEILRMNMTDVITGFFLLRKELRKSVRRSIRLTKVKLFKLRMQTLWQGITRR